MDELVEYHEDSVPAILDDTLVEISRKAEQRVDAVNRIKRAALAVTNPTDWIDQNGKPYLQGSGAEKVARLFGISWRIDEPLRENEEDGHFAYTYKGYFTLGGTTIEAIGTRSSADGFFSCAHGVDIAPSEIDKGDIKKSAFTNCIGNGITRLLGLRNLTWEDVRAGGVDPARAGKVDYAKPEMSKEAKDQRAEILRMLGEMADGDPEKTLDLLEKATAFTGKDGSEVKGKRDISKIGERQLPVTYGKVKARYEKWEATGE